MRVERRRYDKSRLCHSSDVQLVVSDWQLLLAKKLPIVQRQRDLVALLGYQVCGGTRPLEGDGRETSVPGDDHRFYGGPIVAEFDLGTLDRTRCLQVAARQRLDCGENVLVTDLLWFAPYVNPFGEDAGCCCELSDCGVDDVLLGCLWRDYRRRDNATKVSGSLGQ